MQKPKSTSVSRKKRRGFSPIRKKKPSVPKQQKANGKKINYQSMAVITIQKFWKYYKDNKIKSKFKIIQEDPSGEISETVVKEKLFSEKKHEHSIKPSNSNLTSDPSHSKDLVAKTSSITDKNKHASLDKKLYRVGRSDDIEGMFGHNPSSGDKNINVEITRREFNRSPEPKDLNESITNNSHPLRNSENEEQGYIHSTSKKLEAESEKDSEVEHEKSLTKDKFNQFLEHNKSESDDQESNEEEVKELKNIGQFVDAELSEDELVQDPQINLDYKDYIKQLLNSGNKQAKKDDQNNGLSLYSNLAAESKDIDQPVNTTKANEFREDFNKLQKLGDKALFENFDTDSIRKMKGTLPNLDSNLRDYNEIEHKLSPQAEGELEGEDDNLIPENFTELLAGKSISKEKVMHYSTLNSNERQEEKVSETKSQDDNTVIIKDVSHRAIKLDDFEDEPKSVIEKSEKEDEGEEDDKLSEQEDSGTDNIGIEDMISYDSTRFKNDSNRGSHPEPSQPIGQLRSYDFLDNKELFKKIENKAKQVSDNNDEHDSMQLVDFDQSDKKSQSEPEEHQEKQDPMTIDFDQAEEHEIRHEESKEVIISKPPSTLADYDEIYSVKGVDVEDASEDQSSVDRKETLSNGSHEEQNLSSIYGEQPKKSDTGNSSKSKGADPLMKTDDLIDLFSIDPATGREKHSDSHENAKESEKEDEDTEKVEKQTSSDFRNQKIDELFDTNLSEEDKDNHEVDDLIFGFCDSDVQRREIPISDFNVNPSSHNQPVDEMFTSKQKNFVQERWIEREASDLNSERESRTSILSDEANQKVLEIIST